MNYGSLIIEILTALVGLGLLTMGLVVPRDQRKGIGFFAVFALVIIFIISLFTGGKTVSLFNNL